MTKPTTQFASDILHQVRNQLQETLLLCAPEAWPTKDLDAIEKQVLDRTRNAVQAFDADDPGAAPYFILSAVAHAKQLIRQTKNSRTKWLFPDDHDLTTLQVTVPSDFVAAMDVAINQFGLKDREELITVSIEYAMQGLHEDAPLPPFVRLTPSSA